MNTDNFLIEEEDLVLAQSVCSLIKDENIRNRAVANALAANIAKKFFTDFNGEVDTNSGLHNIGCMLEKLDVSDIYLKNNYIDVRVFFNESEVCVPKSHFDNGLEPIAYMFIKLDNDLSNGVVQGFTLSENINKDVCKSGYYHVDPSSLVSFYDIEPSLVNQEDSYSVENKEIFDYFDGCLEDQNAFYSALLASKDGRSRLSSIEKAKRTLAYVTLPDASNNVTSVDILESDEILSDESISLDYGDGDAVVDDLELVGNDESLNLELSDVQELSSDFDDIEPVEDLEQVDVIDEFTQDSANENLLEVDDIVEEQEVAFEMVSDEQANEFETNDVHEESTITNPSEVYSTAQGLNYDIESESLLPEDYNEDNFVEDSLDSQTEEIADKVVEEQEFIVQTQEEDSGSFESMVEDNDMELVAEDLDFVAQNQSEVDDVMNPSFSNDIENLYQNEDDVLENADDTDTESTGVYYNRTTSNHAGKFVSFIIFAAIVAGIGFYGYNKFVNNNGALYQNNAQDVDTKPVLEKQTVEKKIEAMPIETVETAYDTKKNDDFGVAETIPAIEQNLDASILVTNLKVDWEVPATYTSSPVAKRYLTKLGKIIQLNLKTELLLLSKPPITNKITVEIQYDSKLRKFETVGVVVSSGEKTVDNVILQTVQKALNMHLSSNMDSFTVLKGNPVLVIRL